MKYSNATLTLGKLYDDTQSIREYNKQILGLVRKEYYTKKIDFRSYERFINILTCINLQIDEIKEKLNEFIFLSGSGKFGMKIDTVI
ncbi:MAG: hypothetical protein Q8934_15615 [Bacillota bacterium]|nr:hypothetical protein [Bacillota bacterium]